MKTSSVFVYGTLRPGADRFHLIKEYIYKTRPALLYNHQMYSYGPFPGILFNMSAEMPVQGDLLFITDSLYEEAIQTLDFLESNGTLFNRVPVSAFDMLEGFWVRTQVYVANSEILTTPRMVVKNNSWIREVK